MGFLPLVPGIGSCFSPCGSVQTTTSSFCRHDNLVYLSLSLSMRPSTNPRDRLTAIPLPRRNPGLSKNMTAKRLLSPIDRSIWPPRSPIPRKQLRDRCEIAAREGRKAYIHSKDEDRRDVRMWTRWRRRRRHRSFELPGDGSFSLR